MKAPEQATTERAPRVDVPRLRRFNLLMGVLHLGQGIAMLALSSSFSLPVQASFLKLDPATGSLVPHPRTLVALRIGPLVAAFLFLSALAHFLLALPRIYEWYARNLHRGINYARWIEYSLSASLMIVIIAMLVGIYDIAALLALFAVNAAMILFGLMMELHNQTTSRTSWISFWLGTGLGAVPWIAIGIYLFATPGVPTFVYWIYLSIFLFFNCFAVNMALQYKKVGRWRDYLYGERAYMILSLVAKSLLAWQVFAGTLRPS
ncbi:MAG: heliorhodopsin HeR [Actinomycetota bacterium]